MLRPGLFYFRSDPKNMEEDWTQLHTPWPPNTITSNKAISFYLHNIFFWTIKSDTLLGCRSRSCVLKSIQVAVNFLAESELEPKVLKLVQTSGIRGPDSRFVLEAIIKALIFKSSRSSIMKTPNCLHDSWFSAHIWIINVTPLPLSPVQFQYQ